MRNRILRSLVVAAFAAALVPAPASASVVDGAIELLGSAATSQMSFEGLDLSDDPPKSKRKKRRTRKRTRRSGRKTQQQAPAATQVDPTPPPSPAPEAPAGTTVLPGLDLSSDTPAPIEAPTEPPKKDKPAPTMTFDAVDVTGKSAERQRLDAAIAHFKKENYETTALALAEIMRDPAAAELHLEAEYWLGKTLYRMKMYHSSLQRFKNILARGPSTKFFKTSLEWLFFIAHKTVNESVVLDEVAKYADYEFPERFRSEFRYLLARYHFARGKALDEVGQPEEAKKSFDEARRLTLMVGKEDPFYARVKYLEGTISFKEGAFGSALESYKEVVRSNNPRTNDQADIRMRELAFMQLARTHYGHKQNRYAIFYYDKVEPGSDQWLEALFESSWAHFRIGAYERALGNLITLSSPFFKDEYFPEALILKAVIYYENCRYREARAILEEFERTYMPVHNELERVTAVTQDAQRYYDILNEIQKRNARGEGGSVLLERILKLALTDKELKAVNDSILEIEAEMDSIHERRDLFRYSELAKELNEELKQERQSLLGRAGILAKAKLEFELRELKELLGQALRIRFETSTKEKEFLEQQLLAEGGKKEVVESYAYSVAVSDEHLYWPYEGEYWRDELGTYEYTLTKGCRADRQ